MKRMAALVLLLAFATLAGADDKKKENSPDGDWSGNNSCKLKIGGGRLTWQIKVDSQGTVTIHADCSTTKDSLVYAVVTKIESSGIVDKSARDKLPEVDDTFSFRFRVDDEELNVRDLRGKDKFGEK